MILCLDEGGFEGTQLWGFLWFLSGHELMARMTCVVCLFICWDDCGVDPLEKEKVEGVLCCCMVSLDVEGIWLEGDDKE